MLASNGGVTIVFGTTPVNLLQPVAAIARQHVETLPDDQRWLFPGLLPGRPISARHVQVALNQQAIRAKPSRLAALEQLAAELPATVLADLLGIETGVAARWVRKSASDWNSYVAARAVHESHRS
jgi:hypothetical protein